VYVSSDVEVKMRRENLFEKQETKVSKVVVYSRGRMIVGVLVWTTQNYPNYPMSANSSHVCTHTSSKRLRTVYRRDRASPPKDKKFYTIS
jgi:hypothetical protein